MMMTVTNLRYSGYVYDAVWLYARVLDALIRKDKSLVQVKTEESQICQFTLFYLLFSCNIINFKFSIAIGCQVNRLR